MTTPQLTVDENGNLVHQSPVRRSKPHIKRLVRSKRPPLTIAQILAWADEHYQRTGQWPIESSGPIHGTADEKWPNVSQCLRVGLRGLRGGSSLARVLAEHRARRNASDLSSLTISKILQWADEHHEQTGVWPHKCDGLIKDAAGETWSGVNTALFRGRRGLPGGSSLAQILEIHRGVRHDKHLPRFSVAQILAWADAHFGRTGKWPKKSAGAIVEAPGETWSGIDDALHRGSRGLPSGTSLAQVLFQHRSAASKNHFPQPSSLTIPQILAWADAHFGRTGK